MSDPVKDIRDAATEFEKLFGKEIAERALELELPMSANLDDLLEELRAIRISALELLVGFYQSPLVAVTDQERARVRISTIAVDLAALERSLEGS